MSALRQVSTLTTNTCLWYESSYQQQMFECFQVFSGEHHCTWDKKEHEVNYASGFWWQGSFYLTKEETIAAISGCFLKYCSFSILAFTCIVSKWRDNRREGDVMEGWGHISHKWKQRNRLFQYWECKVFSCWGLLPSCASMPLDSLLYMLYAHTSMM